MASYLSSLASPGFHAAPSPRALTAVAAIAAAALSSSAGAGRGAYGWLQDGDEFFASPSPR